MSKNAISASATALPEDCPVTAEFAASLEFQPWDAQEEGWRPPTNQEWNELGARIMPTVRLAWLTMFKTKSEIVELIEGLDREGLYVEHMQNINQAEEAFKGFVQVLNLAAARTIISGAVIELRDGDEEGDSHE